ncbi:MAG: F0F1 ATP synthase subunit alpha [Candidatus Levybacteria bacterium RIFCSPLOWO2_01_FULL_38_21]|nr:MAG: F0F1 ATP synthase subunit alpha [Candidatus Levybacteria bacterium RIFCSPLOWO2_01_FULL_38_21]
MIKNEDIIKELEQNLMSFSQDSRTKNIGVVEKNSDGVVIASGLSRAFMGEQVEFESGNKGVILNLDEDYVSIILFGSGENIIEGEKIRTTGNVLSITVSEKLIGRVISPLGKPLDGQPSIKTGKSMPLEKIAPGVIQREPVNTPLKTGIKLIDTIIPIGRGQRELIIGDRGLGKTAIAVDAIINQKPQSESKLKPVIAVYVAIGQKQSTVAQIIDKLEEFGAMDYTIVVSATASDPAALQYLAPYAGVAISEYFMEKGEDVLIIYDDLTKHAWAYRQISLVLRRPAGREAYPGDIFYLHSRLLERAVKLNKEFGGGSITALPIVETQANDISAYIPTNIISITDGQIYLQSDLFNSGIKPAINIGNSVSRVGGAAQTSAIKFTSGRVRLELAQYRELAVFAQFGSELDSATQAQLERGKRITEVLKQSQYKPLAESLQILSMWAVVNGFLDDIKVESIRKFEEEFHNFIKRNHPQIIKTLSSGEKPSGEALKKMEEAIAEFKKIFSQ